ncbi:MULTISPECIES: PfaB family protein [unclassified Moorena]|uniref:PfaB family protein n=1 Tax=unclassified Moorena TaxID=2683338 RepID=UPI0013C5B2EC|nr:MULTISPECIES: PfaB family protein [unclassified Moorena]NEO18230.1 PfaB family protein [Moorena sp. SIO4A5]NEP21097.1 PfaB family protein [Moorena sp. SIO3I6]NEQ57298.1 PfaB family protein [Moorena sp. SIO4A1]
MDKIAIIGLSCLFPDAKTPEEFWQNLITQKDSTSLLTEEDMGIDPEKFFNPLKNKPDKTYSLMGGYIRDFTFDVTGYNLPSELLEGLDPLFQRCLYVAKQALQDSNYLSNDSVLSKCGVILGNLSSLTPLSNELFGSIYQHTIEAALRELLQNQNFQLAKLPKSAKLSLYNGMNSGVLSALVAQAFSLSDINYTLDSACSSSLYAVKLASHYLLSHKADLMLAGAISHADPIYVRMLFSGVQGYPEHDISRPLDQSSKGLTPADGIGMVVLKRYSDAIRDGDQIYATICGNGLSNDGRGKHLLSPNPRGQILAYKRAYAEANISPKSIDYLECHATGTFLGDTTELGSVDTFFGQHQASMLVGSVKSNLGHLLTAAGMASMIKVILSMSKGVIPPTINITTPLSSPNNVIAAEQVVRAATPWPNNKPLKRAAINAFGFGGNNAHLILEQSTQVEEIPDFEPEASTPVPATKMAIVGMDSFFGSCDGLDGFERSIYDGTQHFMPLPKQRWKGIDDQKQLLKHYGLTDGKAPLGAYIQDFDIDTLRFKIPPNEAETLNPQQLLMLKVTERAIKDAGLSEGGNVAVIIAAETELSGHQLQQRWHLSWQLKEGFVDTNQSSTSEAIDTLESIVKDSIHHQAKTSDYLGYLGVITASRISALWDFNGLSFTLGAGENSTFKALETAQLLLAAGEVDAVVVGAVDLAGSVENVLLRNQLAKVNTGVNTLSYDQNTNGWMVGEGAGAVVLKRLDTVKQEQDRIYAVIDAMSLVQARDASDQVNPFPQPPLAEAVIQACQQAHTQADITPGDIGYLEVFGSGVAQEDEAEICGLTQAYQTVKADLSCAIGSVKANIGHTYAASGIASLIKTALCLYHRYIPATPQWTGPKMPEVWQGSPFYVASASRAWFLEPESTKRVAAINGMGMDGTYAHIILSEEQSQCDRNSNYLEQTPFYLFPIAADGQSELLEQLHNLEQTIENSVSLSTAARQTFATFKKRSQAAYTLAILGHNNDELKREIQRAIKGIPKAFDTGKDWQTPMGSYFTAKPLAKRGTVAFVYPGAFNSYIGLGQNIFRLFPKVYEEVDKHIASMASMLRERLFYPRSLNSLSRKQVEVLEKQLLDDSHSMLISGMGFVRLLTIIMRDYFQVQAQSTFGYSLGELSMMIGQSVWSNYDQAIDGLSSSEIFRRRLSGPKNAVREYWGLPQGNDDQHEQIWSTYVLMTPVSQVVEYLKHENRVYLTHINTPKEVVIAGDPQACRRMIDTLKCDAFRAPADDVLHCDAMASEYHELARLTSLPISSQPDTIFYSAADYKPITLESHAIGHAIAKGLCQPLDFRRLINQVYENGAKIFVEVGAGSTCSRWIGENLKDQEHVTVSLNKRGSNDHTSIVKALAKLVSHHVSLDLSPLYTQEPENSGKQRSMVKTITLGGSPIKSTILTNTNQEIAEALSSKVLIHQTSEHPQTLLNFKPSKPVTSPTLKKTLINPENSANISLNYSVITSEEINSGQPPLKIPLENNHSLELAQNSNNLMLGVNFSELYKNQYKKLSYNTSHITKNHAAFLRNQQESLKQIGDIIQHQVTFSKQLLDSES